MRAALYCRVSTTTQAKDGASLERQDERGRAYLLQHGIELVEVVADDFTGRLSERPGLRRLRELAAARLIDCVVVAKVDRLARRQHVGRLLEEELARAGVRVLFTDQHFDATPTGRFLRTVVGGVAELESDLFAERATGGRWDKARGLKGAAPAMPCNGRTLGYRQISAAEAEVLPRCAGRSGHLEVVAHEADLVRHIFALFTEEGLSLRQLAARLNTEGHPTVRGTLWYRETVRVILTNTAYIGTRHFGKRAITRSDDETNRRGRPRVKSSRRDPAEWAAMPTPPIIDEQTFTAAAALLRRNLELRRGRPSIHPWPLRGVVYCATCKNRDGSPYACVGNAPPRRVRRYRCRSYHETHTPTCGAACPADQLERIARDALLRLARAGFLERLCLRALADRRRASPQGGLQSARADLAALLAAEQRVWSGIAAVGATDAGTAQARSLAAQVGAAKARVAALEAAEGALPEDGEVRERARVAAADLKRLLAGDLTTEQFRGLAQAWLRIWLEKGAAPRVEWKVEGVLDG